ncbi:MAG TPA: hypothetical protein DIT16_09090 [Clostridium sp.]|nr:hypothetical protein [Clostridium sp.]
MNELVNTRDIEVIAAEINNIKEQTRIMVLNNSIEIGRRLVEAKSIIQHGQWGRWLEESVNYSQRTANNLMRIFEEYGSNQISLFGASNSQAFANLNYSQAVALLGIPDIEEREAFIKENNAEDMSSRELQQVIKAKEKAEKEKEEALKLAAELKIKSKQMEEEKATLESDIRIKEESLKLSKENIDKLQDTLEREREGAKLEANKLNKSIKDIKKQLKEAKGNGNDEEIDRLQAELNKKQNEETDYLRQIQELGEKLKEKPVDVETIEKVPEEVENELKKLREKVNLGETTSKFKVNFDILVKNFNDLFSTLSEMPEEVKEKYSIATKTLISKMQERL